jgi:hypothetical protein
MSADPNLPLAAFAEYASSSSWVAVHLMQLFGAMLMAASFVMLSRKLADGAASAWATLGAASGRESGSGRCSASCRWRCAEVHGRQLGIDTKPGKAGFFDAAFAVRQVEVGLASISALFFGLTVSIYGIALLIDRRFPCWIGAFAIVGGVPTAVGGIAMAYTGFSNLAMDINMPFNSLLILWMIALGIYGWRQQAF